MRTAHWVHKASRGVRGLARFAIGALFVYSGWVKLRDPRPAAEFLEGIVYTELPWTIPILAIAEIALGLWLLIGARQERAGKVAFALFIGFGVLHAYASAANTASQSCGCLGSNHMTSGWGPGAWITFNVALAGVAALIAFRSPLRADREHNKRWRLSTILAGRGAR
jgi:uncharacterized membrane protein YphA (DoxX/SURF4 family)